MTAPVTVFRLTLLTFLAALTSGCVQLTFAWTDLTPKKDPASPDILGHFGGLHAFDTINAQAETEEEWRENFAPAYREALQDHVYGRLPDESSAQLISRVVLNEKAFNGKGRLEELVIEASATFGDQTVATVNPDASGLHVELVIPNDARGPMPVILIETFCPRWGAVPDPAVKRPEGANDISRGFAGTIASYVFGRYICTPPFEEILSMGFAVAVFHPSEVIPDRREQGLQELLRLSAGHENDETRWGAIGAWGWLFSRVVDVMEKDKRLDMDGVIVWGHSRYGKAALVAAAFDARIKGVISHQSGTGGASLNRRKRGESIEAITNSYPHWFSKAYAGYGDDADLDDLSIDQHMLLALIAPRPVLLGNARRDVWSDPNGAFRAAMGADAAYELLGARGLTVKRLDEFDPSAELSFWLRPGTHGVVQEDWPAFLEFLEAHFMRGES